jgi:glycosyltransferase involved in cell wall biosynthesis
MKIAHVVDYFQPQLGYQETFLAQEHARMGHSVWVITSDRYSPILYTGESVKKLLGDRVVKPGFFIEEGVAVWRLKTLIEFPRSIWMIGLEKKILEINPDIVIVHGIANIAAIRIALLKGNGTHFKLIYDDHMTFEASRHYLRFLYPLFKFIFAPIIIRKSNALVGVADTCKLFMNKMYGFPLDKILVIPLGADTTLFKYDSVAKEKIRKSLGISENEVIFTYAGKIIPVKGPHLLIEAAVELHKNHENIKILLIGNGPSEYIQKIRDYLKLHRCESICIFHDSVKNSELPQFYSAADVAVWPKEASLSMFEAMACQLPVIISIDSEVQERLSYNNGFLYNANDNLDLAKKMELLLDRNTRKIMGENGREIVNKKFSWKVIGSQFADLF